MIIPPERACRHCLARYAQEDGLCRNCQYELGLTVETTVDRETVRVAAYHAKLAKLRESSRPIESGIVCTPLRDVVIDGQEYTVVWDGSVNR